MADLHGFVVGGMVEKILIVCIGNICRSPIAENLLREGLTRTGVAVESAGLSAMVDSPIEPLARLVLEECGCIPKDHKAVQLTSRLVIESDLILVMERRHLKGVFSIAPEARGKVFLLGKWQENREISDPYRQGKPAFVHAFALIKEATDAWAQRLTR